MDCIFCKIVEGTVPSCKVYEDDTFLAFMDIAPIAVGHTLVIPKVHCVNVFDTPDDVAVKYYSVISKVARAIKKAYGADGMNIMQFNDKSAGQEVYHAHIHLIPRYNGDNLGIHVPPRLKVSVEEIQNNAEKIKKSFCF